MNNTLWDFFNDIWARTYYTQLAWLSTSILAVVIGLKNFQKNKSQILLLIFLSSSLIPLIVFPLIRFYALHSKNSAAFLETMNTLYSMLEITVFLLIFKYQFRTRRLSQLINFILISFLSISITFISLIIFFDIQSDEIRQYSFLLDSIEFLFLLLLSLLYFYRLLTSDVEQTSSIVDNKSFWIVGGLFFYSVVSLPLLIIAYRFFLENEQLYLITGALHYVSISFLNLCLAKALLCRANPSI
jgi:hypothetical protein